eukprot:762419-Hanusia_phi.AAC.3
MEMSNRLSISCGGVTLLTSLVPDKGLNRLWDRRRGRETLLCPAIISTFVHQHKQAVNDLSSLCQHMEREYNIFPAGFIDRLRDDGGDAGMRADAAGELEQRQGQSHADYRLVPEAANEELGGGPEGLAGVLTGDASPKTRLKPAQARQR